YDHDTVTKVLPGVLSALSGAPVPMPVGGPAPRLRPKKLLLERQWSLAGLVEEGGTLEIEACAHDFNRVVAFNAPGRSRKVRLRVVSKAKMKALVSDAQTQIEKELKNLRDRQEQAMRKVIGAEQQWRATGKLRPGDLHDVEVAEIMQQQL